MRFRPLGFSAIAALLLTSCGGGGDSGSSPTPAPTPTPTPAPTNVYTAPAQESLSIVDVETIVARAAAEAQARGAPAIIAVTDRLGNVLAVFRMNGARDTAIVSAAPNGVNMDVQNLTIPASAGAIAKAITGAYLSSGGNAFSSRTASQIVQQHFPPAPSTAGLESGPLFGVQFSQLPCSDLNARFSSTGTGALIGPKRSPLGLSADPGGFPLYKNGVLVGGIGVMADGLYGFDPNTLDVDDDADEHIALAGTVGFEAPETIRANRITVDGTSLRYNDATYAQIVAGGTPSYTAALSTGNLIAVRGYFGDISPAIRAGTSYGSEASGIRAAKATEFANVDAFILTDGAGANRYPVRAGTDGGLTAAESAALLEEAFKIMARARGQIRQPLDSRAQVSISLVDTTGAVLGVVRAPDAPLFGTDVSLQKARTVAYFSGPTADADLSVNTGPDIRAFVSAFESFLSEPNSLNGKFAMTARSIGNLSRPYFPDGEVGRPQGPLSRPVEQFNPFSTGLQSALITGDLATHLSFIRGGRLSDVPQLCTGIAKLANGIQIFPGAVPVYRGNVLVGGLGVSGDGIDQDDMISFLGLTNGGARIGGGIGQAPATIRSDQIVIAVGAGVRLRYVSCPFAPFLDSSANNVCQGF